jgi:hypothetical protein
LLQISTNLIKYETFTLLDISFERQPAAIAAFEAVNGQHDCNPEQCPATPARATPPGTGTVDFLPARFQYNRRH